MNQPNPMDVVGLSQTIDEFLAKMPSLEKTTSSIGLSKTDIQQLNILLKKIQPAVKNHVQGQEVPQVWLRILKTTVNDLNDLVEELSTDYVKPQKRTFNFLKSKRHKLRLKDVNTKIKTVLEGLQKVSDALFPATTRTTATNSLPQEVLEKTEEETELDPAILGRKDEIIDQLILFNKDPEPIGKVSVVTIVGFAGIGKTKLARLICKDAQIKANFGLQILIDDVGSIKNYVNDPSLTATNGKGNLVVLDNLKTEILGDDILIDLDKILMTCNGASAILITTRSKFVANNMTVGLRAITLYCIETSSLSSSSSSSFSLTETTPNTIFTTFKPYVFPGLNEEESRSLFSKIRGENSSKFDVEEMEQKIMMDWIGVPFLIILTAMFLKNRVVIDLTKEEFLQELKVEFYDKLPRPKKMCFAFFSLFPRDHLIDVERLIHLWTAEGFQSNSENSTTEENLREYFNDFVGIPIFKDMEEDKYGAVRRCNCKMQPLMHDLARFVSDQKENVIVDPEGEKVHEGVLRASFDFSLDVLRGIPPSLFEKAKKLRAILFWSQTQTLPSNGKENLSTCRQILKTFKTTLRMLDLHDLGIKTVPKSIGDMNNLRYLNLSSNSIKKLPRSITKLINLQTLKLSQCYLLEELPNTIYELINLKHLEIDSCSALNCMPRKLHKLENSLQTLSLFVVSEEYSLDDLSGLARLNNLRGHLEISHLERCSLNLSKDGKNYLTHKNHLQDLTLRWNNDDDYDESADKYTLDCLEPPSKLRAILIVGYKGKKLSLNNCTSCISLPHLDELPNLRFLELLRLDKLQFIADHKDGDSDNNQSQASAVYFPSLEELTISDCPNLKNWWKEGKTETDIPSFVCLSKLNVSDCPKLICLPLFPDLDEELVLVGSSVKPLMDTIAHSRGKGNPFSKLKSMKIAKIKDGRSPPKKWIEHFNSLEKLDIKEWKHLKFLTEGFAHLTSLQSLYIENCQELDLDLSSTGWKGLKNLRSLNIRDNPKLETLPLGVYEATSLQDLEIHNCPLITYLPKTIANLKSLGKLVISECNKLRSVPKALENMESLDTLNISDCTLLLPRCEPGGPDWPQIAHIKNKEIRRSNRLVLVA